MKHVAMLVLFMLLGFITACHATPGPTAALIPLPNEITLDKGVLRLDVTPSVAAPASLAFAVTCVKDAFARRMDIKLVDGECGTATVQLVLNPKMGAQDAYTVVINPEKVIITGSTPGAVLYGVMTLDQVMLGDVPRTVRREIACLRICDTPRFPYRAMLLDPARHFLPLDDVKRFLDVMAWYKFNVLQFHLTDDQGWRVEIKKYPKLTEIGARRNAKAAPHAAPHNGFYTQAQLKELVAYAAERNIEIVPEFDMPGHTVAVLAAYPELGCEQLRATPAVVGKTVDRMLCAANPATAQFCCDVIEELASIFPSKRVHLGGDESVIEKNWGHCPRCQALMKEKEYQVPSQIMNVFFEPVFGALRAAGKEPVMWCELNAVRPPANTYLFDYPKDVTLVSWRAQLTPKCLELTARHGNPLIMAPGEHCYLDYPQGKGDLPEHQNWGMPILPLERAYAFDPGYGKPQNEQAHVLGVMATLWGEAIQTIDRANYMAFPRALAIAEAGWTQMPRRSWEDFRARLYPNVMDLMQRGIAVRAPYEIAR